MKSCFVITGLLSLGVLLAGCDNAPPSTAQQSAEKGAPEKKIADLMKRAENGDTQAQFELGHYYEVGGSVSAQLYLEGEEGSPKDAVKAVAWY